ncbi:uncharacterized protein [Littorina saxatilis]
MSSYNDLSKYYGDFQFLKEMKTVAFEEILRMKAECKDPDFWNSQVKRGFHTETDDGRDMRVILPNGFRAVSDLLPKTESLEPKELHNLEKGVTDNLSRKEIHFVGFVGTKLDASLSRKDVVNEMIGLDNVLVTELAEIDGMLAYVSGERVKGGDYTNLVLFRDRGVAEELLKSSNHGKAVNALAPEVFSDVHIHSGVLQDGLTSSFFVLRRTIFLCFTVPPEDPRRRRVQMWRACRKESDVVKVLPRPPLPDSLLLGLGSQDGPLVKLDQCFTFDVVRLGSQHHHHLHTVVHRG